MVRASIGFTKKKRNWSVRGRVHVRVLGLSVVVGVWRVCEHEALFASFVDKWREFDDGVYGQADVWRAFPGKSHVVGIDEPEDALVGDNEEWFFVSFHFKDHGIEAMGNVEIRFSAGIAVGELVFLASFVLFWVVLLDFVVGEPVAGTGKYFVEVGPVSRS